MVNRRREAFGKVSIVDNDIHFDKDHSTRTLPVYLAMAFATQYKLDNLVNIIDVNRLGQSEPTMYQHDMDVYRKRTEAFGWHTQVIDGHSIEEITAALAVAGTIKGQPCCILAKTHKGKFFPGKQRLPNNSELFDLVFHKSSFCRD